MSIHVPVSLGGMGNLELALPWVETLLFSFFKAHHTLTRFVVLSVALLFDLLPLAVPTAIPDRSVGALQRSYGEVIIPDRYA